MARRKDPYMIVPLKFGDIYDFKDFTKKYMKFRKEDVNGKKLNWLQIKWIRYTQENPDCIMFKYNFEDEFRVLKVAGTAKPWVYLIHLICNQFNFLPLTSSFRNFMYFFVKSLKS
jgi:hypothetical protein